jgi:hypothetical protein
MPPTISQIAMRFLLATAAGSGGRATKGQATPGRSVEGTGFRKQRPQLPRSARVDDMRPFAATELILTALELPDVQRSWFPYVPPIVGTIGSGETPAATAWATVRTSAR